MPRPISGPIGRTCSGDDRLTDEAMGEPPDEEVHELEARGFPPLFAPAASLVARVVSGDDFASHTMLGEIARMGDRPVFVTHGELDGTTLVSHVYELIEAAEAADVPLDTWIVEDAGHVHAMFLHSDEYQARLEAFLGEALGR